VEGKENEKEKGEGGKGRGKEEVVRERTGKG
jgi:hypothetical protein